MYLKDFAMQSILQYIQVTVSTSKNLSYDRGVANAIALLVELLEAILLHFDVWSITSFICMALTFLM